MVRAFDVFGNIAIVNFPRGLKGRDKQKFANKILRENSNIKTVLEKSGKIKGRLRKPTLKFIAGEKTKEVLYKENNCLFRFNVDTTYFSPRLSNERKEIALKIKKNENVLVMFAGVAPFSIVIAKNSKAKKVVSVEINREASKYAKLNVELNKVKDRVEIVQANVKNFMVKSPTQNVSHPKAKDAGRNLQKFDSIVMARPQLKNSFLKEAFRFAKKGTRIFYYDFCGDDEIDLVVEKILTEAKECKKKVKILGKKKAGEIAPYKIRCRVDFRVV